MAWVKGAGPTAGGDVGSIAQAFGSNVTSGNLVVVSVTQVSGAGFPRAISSVADTVNTYTLAKTHIGGAGPNARTDTYYCIASTTATLTVTVTFTGGLTDCAIALNEYDTTKALETTNSNGGTGTTATPGSVTPVGTGQYIATLVDQNSVAITPPGGAWNTRQNRAPQCAILVIDQSTTGAQNPSTTLGATPGEWSDQIIVFRAGPVIDVQPQNTFAHEGNTAVFTISATTTGGALSYQWKWNGSNVGSNSSSYTTPALVASTDNGATITCDVTDTSGTFTSNNAILSVRSVGKPCWVRA